MPEDFDEYVNANTDADADADADANADADAEDVRAQVQWNLRAGVSGHCPCCGQFYKAYKRKLHSTMALALIVISQHFRQYPRATWLHVPEFLATHPRTRDIGAAIAGGDTAKLRHWGVLAAQEGVRADGSTRIGYYRITSMGTRFVDDEIAVPRYIHIYNQRLRGFSEETVRIREALGDRFNYDELMAPWR